MFQFLECFDALPYVLGCKLHFFQDSCLIIRKSSEFCVVFSGSATKKIITGRWIRRKVLLSSFLRLVIGPLGCRILVVKWIRFTERWIQRDSTECSFRWRKGAKEVFRRWDDANGNRKPRGFFRRIYVRRIVGSSISDSNCTLCCLLVTHSFWIRSSASLLEKLISTPEESLATRKRWEPGCIVI